ncbi:uncharacterized protein LOC100209879 isoform X1 [Hydra vulgaris]|uniref:uncharacterized protein LOC100209879 isoform X1 n=1 Tax=Hydra vulgaris TaxID=6087 RepID=UPI0032E9BF0C
MANQMLIWGAALVIAFGLTMKDMAFYKETSDHQNKEEKSSIPIGPKLTFLVCQKLITTLGGAVQVLGERVIKLEIDGIHRIVNSLVVKDKTDNAKGRYHNDITQVQNDSQEHNVLQEIIFNLTISKPIRGGKFYLKTQTSIKATKFSAITTTKGYRRVFEEYANVVQQRYPHLSISGNNYPAPIVNNYIAKASNILKWSALAVITLGERVSFWQNLNIPNPPEIYQWTQNHKIMSCVGVFFIGNTIENGLLQTGAFEIYFNDVLIWSKLKTQKLPSVEELLLRIKNNMDDKKMSSQEDKFASPILNDREHKKSGEFDEFDKNDFGSENTVDLNNQYEF